MRGTGLVTVNPAPSAMIRHALIVEDRPATAEVLKALLEHCFPGVALRHADRVGTALALLDEGAIFDLALIDLGLPDGSGVDVVAALAERYPACQRVVTSIFSDDVHLFPALRAGATGYLLKDQPQAQLARSLLGMLAGEPPLSPAIARRLLQVFAPQQSTTEEKLSPRERETLSLIARGLSLRDVAGQLGVTRNTAAGYLKSVYRKLNVNSRAEATLEAVRRGLIGASL